MTYFRTTRTWLALPVAAGLIAPAVLGQSAADCAAIESASDRLACFDAAYGRSDQPAAEAESSAVGGSKSQPAAVAGAATATAAATASPSEAEFGIQKSKAETEGESLVSGIASVSRDGYDKLIFELDNGQVWRQTENKRFIVEAGDVAEIRHGSFGSYKLYIQGGKVSTRVRRAQ